MPKIKSKLEKKKTYDEEILQKALHDIKRGTPKKTVSKKYGIPRSTLQFRMSEKFTKIRRGPRTILSELEEQLITEWLIDCQRKGFPRRKGDILAAVNNFLKENPRTTPFNENGPGIHWYKGFLNRHPILTSRTPEPVTRASSNVSKNDIQKWFKDIEVYLESKNYFEILSNPSRVFNGDETCFQLCPNTGKVIAPKGSQNVYEVEQGPSKTNITVMFTFSAAGVVTPPMVIYAYKRLPPKIAESVPAEWGIGK